MPHRLLLVVLVAAIATLNVLTGAAQGQTPAPPPLTYERVITSIWKDLHDKILVMAKDTVFPDDKLGWKPHPDSRSVLEEFRHVTIGLELSSAQLRGEKLDRAGVMARQKADAGKPQTRASIVSEMEAAIAVSYPLVEKSPNPRLIGWIEDNAEHYGKLVSNYRALGIVPPFSRKTGGDKSGEFLRVQRLLENVPGPVRRSRGDWEVILRSNHPELGPFSRA